MKKWILFTAIAFAISSCEKEKRECPGAAEKTFDLAGFHLVKAGETFNLAITKGNGYSVKAKGCADDLADLELSVAPSGELDIKYKRYKQDRYRVDFTISVPEFGILLLQGASKATINGFDGRATIITSVLSGNAECTINGTPLATHIDLSGTSVLHLTGNTDNLYGNMSGNSQLNSYGVSATEVDISVSGTSKAFVKPVERFFAEASGESRVYYKGNPPTTHFVTSGNGRIIRD
jgi:Putative auto-transporter adhesin, head GIN domain